jgi:6-phosphogluconolactonase
VDAARSRGRFSVALSGGSTPAGVYRLLAEEPFADRIPWSDVHIFWGDERCVPPNDPGSNYRLAQEALLSRVPIPADNIHRIRGEVDPSTAARVYDAALQDFFCGPRSRFDLVLLGLGTDGHTASLFPGSSALEETEQLAEAVVGAYEGRPAQRVTLTLPAINSAREALFLVSGAAKAGIVRAVLEGSEPDLPARRVRLTAGRLTWLLDADAAAHLAGGAVSAPAVGQP